MVRNRVISFPRQIAICLSLCLIAILVVLSCQKDEGLKQKDPNALTKSQAKEYFEQTASTLIFLTTGTTPAGTKNADYSLTENMIINWDQALEGETADSYVVEVPIRMVHGLDAAVHKGLGQFNNVIKKVAINSSLLIFRLKGSGDYSHKVVYSVGEYLQGDCQSKFPFSSNKEGFSGYLITSSENGAIEHFLYYENNNVHTISASELITSRSQKIDKFGKDLPVMGFSLTLPVAILTKGGGGTSSGEDNLCPYCLQNGLSFNGDYYYCSNCNGYVYIFEYLVCPDCLSQLYNCLCICSHCGFFKKDCKCRPDEDELCPECGLPGCNGRCQQGGDNGIPYCDVCECPATQCHCGQYTVCPNCGQLNCDGHCDGGNN